MSLISDALKRQEQLRAAPGAGAAQHEVSVAAPPEVSVAAPPEVAVATPPEVAAAVPPEVSAATPPEVSAATPPEVAAAVPPEVSVATPPETSPRQRPNFAAPAAQPRAASPRPTSPPSGGATSRGVAAQNPFLARERAAARRPNHSILLMPVIGLFMLLVLLFLRREFVPRERAEDDLPRTPRKVEDPAPVLSRDDSSREEGIGKREQGTGSCRSADGPSADGRDEARPSQAVDEGTELSTGAPAQVQREAAEPSALRQEAPPPTSPPPVGPTSRGEAAPTSPLSGGPTSRGDAAPNLAASAAQPQPPKWPAFTLTGIAVGRERLAILNTGEMLLAGETAKNGVKVKEVNASTVVFAWGGETKTLRKGEHSDKPAD